MFKEGKMQRTIVFLKKRKRATAVDGVIKVIITFTYDCVFSHIFLYFS